MNKRPEVNRAPRASETELQAILDQGEARHAMLAAAVEQAAEAIVITDAAGVIEYVNPAFETITGYTREKALGQNPRILKSGKHNRDFYRVLWREITQGGTWSGKLVNRREDGSEYHSQATIRGVRFPAGEGADGSTVKYLSVQQDVTEQEELQAQLLRAQKLEAVGTLAGGIAHDFNNILTGILSGVELVKMIVPADSEAQDHLTTAVAEIGRAAQLSRKLLDMVRKDEPSWGYLNLQELVPDLLRLLSRSIPETIEIEYEIEPGLPAIRGDSGRVEQALLNLAINARDAMPEGGILSFDVRKLEIPAREQLRRPAHLADRFLRITVSDNGQGMAPEVKEHIFEPFFTTKGPGEGSGLGLAMVHACVEAHAGWITVDSELGAGARFQIFLPATLAGEEPLAIEEPEQIIAGEGMAGEKGTILLVDDAGGVLRAESRALERPGYHVLQSRDGEQALAELDRLGNAVQLVVTDLVMPRLGGRELLLRLRESGYSMPVIATSGYSPGTAGDLIKEGFAAFLAKPFQISKLVGIVRGLLDAEALPADEEAPS